MDHVFTTEEAKTVGDILRIDWNKINLEDFRVGMNIELEHGTENPQTNITNDDPLTTGKIALAHLRERPDYYKLLVELEEKPEFIRDF
ncbi:MAG: hypothetical protein KGJ07_06175 [Patescibacteria group bacterium]|nr:hypothetical protein [Patescibacteria group bacterium]MDE2588226.1 hypothetical protein [Patescibacteria group bacterium]